jgi:hypothetical protein
MRTTLDLPDPLFREAKIRAIQQGVKLKDLINRYIEAGLRGPSLPPAAPGPRPRSPIPVAIPKSTDSPTTPILTNAELNAILEEEEMAEYRKVLNPSLSGS